MMFPKPRYHMFSCDELHRRMLASASNIFGVLADIDLEECFEVPDISQESWVTALVGFEGTYSGLVALHCPEPLARRIAAGLLRSENELNSQDLCDAIGEIVNILSGDMKLFLNSGGRQVRLSTPSVFVGDGDFHDEFVAVPETVTCTMAAGEERLLIGVQISRGNEAITSLLPRRAP